MSVCECPVDFPATVRYPGQKGNTGECYSCGQERQMPTYQPKRIQLRRTKGWKLPDGARAVTRPHRFGNPFKGPDAAEDFERYITMRQNPRSGWADILGYPSDEEIREELGGRDLACFCSPLKPCHVTTLLRVANEPLT